jgi:hypothetical protein
MKEQSQKHARKHIKVGCYLKVTLVYKGLRRRGISYIEQRERRLTGLVTSYVETAFRNTLLKER